MIPACKPPNEELRLEALRRYKILDTAPEEAFDDLTLVASQVCGTPIALVSLVDADRQWFKSHLGLAATETHRDLAFCAHAIQTEDTFVVPDATLDERFHDNPLVTGGLDIRFYAGSRITTPDGFHLGALCVIDTKPRGLPPEQRQVLEALARQVSRLLDLRQAAAQLADALEHMRTLHSFLPICSYCKGIRDEEGAWHKLEEYVTSRTDTVFSHGICKPCMAKNFPDFAARLPGD
jgi:GAF domain-containing protein